MRYFSKCQQQYTLMLRNGPAQPGRVSKHARPQMQHILGQPLPSARHPRAYGACAAHASKYSCITGGHAWHRAKPDS